MRTTRTSSGGLPTQRSAWSSPADYAVPCFCVCSLIHPFGFALRHGTVAVYRPFLSESSLFISPHRLILKTCGTTLNLLGLPRILNIARTHAGLPAVHRCFYSRKSFMFPERQLGPHREWKDEVEFLDRIFPDGAAYTVGKVNGDHWLLYMAGEGYNSGLEGLETAPSSPELPTRNLFPSGTGEQRRRNGLLYRVEETEKPLSWTTQDYTIEILMTHLDQNVAAPFYTPSSVDPYAPNGVDVTSPSDHAQLVSRQIGIAGLFPRHLTTLDAYAFSPCGYSSNALLKWGSDPELEGGKDAQGEGYYTIHVTPEDGFSYASFECNVPLAPKPVPGATLTEKEIPDLRTLIRRVVRIFQPGKITLTLFVSAEAQNGVDDEDDDQESAVELAQRAFKAALTRPGEQGRLYDRTDKINYEFGGYELAFASFEVR